MKSTDTDQRARDRQASRAKSATTGQPPKMSVQPSKKSAQPSAEGVASSPAPAMDVAAIEDFLLACHAAKHLITLLPDLPDGLGPRDVRILDTIGSLEEAGGNVRVSDVSERMEVSRPGVTRDVSKLEAAGLVDKAASSDDGRLVFVRLTDEGRRVRKRYVTDYHEHLAEVLSDMDPRRLKQASETIREAHARIADDRAAGSASHKS